MNQVVEAPLACRQSPVRDSQGELLRQAVTVIDVVEIAVRKIRKLLHCTKAGGLGTEQSTNKIVDNKKFIVLHDKRESMLKNEHSCFHNSSHHLVHCGQCSGISQF